MGKGAEEEFCEMTNAVPLKRGDPRGDAEYRGRCIEIKNLEAVKHQNSNPVRAVKYITLVVRNPPNDGWYVIPASDVVRNVERMAKGQHTEIAFECARLNLNRFDENRSKYSVAKPAPEQLQRKVEEAIAEAEGHPELERLMAKVLADVKELARVSKAERRAPNFGRTNCS